MESEPRRLVLRMRHNRRSKLVLQTAVIHVCCSVACIIIGIFSMAIIKSSTIETVYGLPLWIGLLLLLTGFSGIQCHLKRTKYYAGLFMLLSVLSMFLNLIGIAWTLSVMKKSEVVVISAVCVSTFDMGIACLSTALSCNVLHEDCKMYKHRRRASTQETSPCHVDLPQEMEPETNEERVQLATQPLNQVRYTRPNTVDVPPPYTDVVEPPPPYSEN